ncbi:TPA: hypothetical protein ACH3X1_005385 [Trebouxia sp. C0004]
MASSPAVPFKPPTPSRRLGTGEVKRRMQQTTARQLAILHNSPEFQQWRAGDTAQAYREAPPRQLWQSLQPWVLPLLATMCLLLLTMLLLRPASNDADQWQGSFASWEDALQQLQANEHEWAPPGALAAALSTFKATLQDVTHSTNSLKKEHDMLARKHAEADGAVQAAWTRQQQLEHQLGTCADKSLHLQQVLDRTSSQLTASQRHAVKLQAQVAQLLQQQDRLAAKLSTAESKLHELEPLPPKLAKVSSEAEVCRKEMSTLTGSQAKVHESLQAYLHQEKELRQGLTAAEHHLSRLGQDYAVCQDTSAHLRFTVLQSQVGADGS